jgi:hypothetical protein
MLIGLAVVLSAALAGTAPAATRVAGDDVAAGVELAGSRVVWGSTAPDGSLEVRSAVPGAAPVTLFAYGRCRARARRRSAASRRPRRTSRSFAWRAG